MIRMIYLPITDAGDLADCLAEALPLARAFGGHVCVDFIRPDPRGNIPFVGEGLTADVIQDLVEAAEREGRARADRALAVFRDHLAAGGVAIEEDEPARDEASARFHESVGLITERVGRMARVHDVSVVPRPGADHRPEASELFDEALFRSGRPVLLAPPRAAHERRSGPDRSPYRRVVIGWNGRAEAARAVADALALLRRAEEVDVVTVGDEHPERPGVEGLRRYLARHEIAARIVRRPATHDVAEALLDHARERKADLLVLGAYSHSRWREMIVGGVTRHMVHHSPIALFMSH